MFDYAQQGYEPERGDQPTSYSPYTHHNPQRADITKLQEITMEDYGLTPSAVRAYMFGLVVQDPETGKPMGDEFYKHTLENAVAQAEQKFDIAIFPRIEVEHHDYNSADFNSYMYTKVFKRPIIQVEELKLEMNGHTMYAYPSNWWKVYNLAGHIELSPTPLMQAGSLGGGMMYSGMSNLAPMMGTNKTFAPQMIHLRYVAGLLPRQNATFNRQWEMPATLEKLILKIAIREVFELWGRLIITPGIASTSLSMDGITESIGTTQSAMYGAASADIAQLNSDIEDLEKDLRGYFGDNFMTV